MVWTWGKRKDTVRKIHRRIPNKPDLEEAAGACVLQPDSWRWPAEVWSKSGNISTRCSSMKRSGSGVHVFELAFEHMEDILNTNFSYIWYLYRGTLTQSYVCAVACSGHFCFGGDLTKPSIAMASVDRFYLNLVVCLQLDVALLIQNSVKI